MSELAAALQRFHAAEPILARPPGTLYRLGKAIRRRRTGIGVAAALTVLLLAGISVSVLFDVQARRADQTRLADRRQYAIEKALVTAWTGDLGAMRSSLKWTGIGSGHGGFGRSPLRLLNDPVNCQVFRLRGARFQGHRLSISYDPCGVQGAG